jgi:hypothetical protein
MDDAAAAHINIYTIPRFRSHYFLPISRPCPIVPVAFVVLQDGHFFTVIMDYKKAQVYVLGKSSVHGGDTAEWQEWYGPRIYSHICCLHGWRVPEDMSAIEVLEVNWTGNGYNCGPTSIKVVLDLSISSQR